MRTEGVAGARRFGAMQRSLRERAKLRDFLRLLTLLALPGVPLAVCHYPILPNFVVLQANFRNYTVFPDGTIVKYDCILGYVPIPGSNSSLHCIGHFQWSGLYPYCEGFCPRPPKMKTIKLKEKFAAMTKFPVNIVVEYECKEGYRPHSQYSNGIIACQNTLKWTETFEFCRRSCPFPPNKNGARVQAHFLQLQNFPVGTVVKYDCVGQYKRIPHTSNSITCGRNFQWSLMGVFCEESCPLPPTLSYAKVEKIFENTEFFPVGRVVTYECKEGYMLTPGIENYVRCGNDLQWSNPKMFCRESCGWPPNLQGAKLKKEFENLNYFPAGTVIKYDCDRGFEHIPGTDNSLHCDNTMKWLAPVVFCKAMECDDPVIEHGVKVTGLKNTHVYGNNIAFECNIGYYMIGSYLIQCGENNVWNPKVPSCEKITAKLCGAPLVPGGIVHPSEPQYKLGTNIVIQCNPQYSFPDETLEMTTICQGHNLWKPPAQPCMFRTSPDITELTIYNGIIVRGKKEKYKPGDNVTIKCNAGYSLQGPPVVRYIGGKKWSPRVPYCSLSFFFRLLIAGM